MKINIFLTVVFILILFVGDVESFSEVRLFFPGVSGPQSISISPDRAAAASMNLHHTAAAAAGEGALRLLVTGYRGHKSYFPAGTQVDRIDYDGRGYVLFMTFPKSFTKAGPQEPITDLMMQAVAQTMTSIPGAGYCRVLARDFSGRSFIPIGRLFHYPTGPPAKPYEDAGDKTVGPPSVGQPQPAGFLSGKSIFLSPGHGWYYDSGAQAWQTQRGNTNGLVEDFSNPEAVLQFLAPYFWNSGAGVYTVRERDMNTSMLIIDNRDDACATTGDWSASTSVNGFYGQDYWTAPVSTNPTATATFTLAVPEDGFYHVYLWYTSASNRATDCHITIRHAGGDTLAIQNLRRDGFTWKDLGRYYFSSSDPIRRRSVVISNQGSDSATYVVADAVRVGGGTDEDADKPRWEMSGMYYAPFMGCPQCVTNTVTTMPLYVAWENEGWEDGIYISWHTNAPNPGSGTSSFAYASGGWDEPFDGVPGSLELRDAIHEEIVDDLRAGWDAAWIDQGVHTNWYGEINPNYNDETPGALFEMAFHDTPHDAEQLKEPAFRKLVARAVYQGAVRYFAARDGQDPKFLPEPPRAPAAIWQEGQIETSWLAPDYDYGGLAGDPAEGYRLYLGTAGKGFADAEEVKGSGINSRRLRIDRKSVPNYLRLSAFNAGGESMPTETMAVSGGDGPRVLIVNGFDRLDKYANIPEAYYGGGTIYRGYLNQMNTYDYVIAHAEALAAAGVDFDSASNEAVLDEAVELADYPAVVWIVGEESTADTSLSPQEQLLLSQYLDNGGALFISGSEIGWDLWANGSDSDRAFYRDYLQADFTADTAGVGQISSSGIFADIEQFNFDYQDYLIYAANYPDALSPRPAGTSDMFYTGTDYGAAIVADTGVFRVVYLGFPFETIYSSSIRNTIMAAAMDFLLPEPPGDDDTVEDDDSDDDSADDDLTDDDAVNDDQVDDDADADDTEDDDQDHQNADDDQLHDSSSCGC